MTKEEIRANFRQRAELSEDDFRYFFSLVEERKLKKNRLLVEQGSTQPVMAFVKDGGLMTYHEDQNKFKHVLQFGMPAWWTGDLETFSKGTASLYSISTLLDSEVYMLSADAFEQLLIKAPAFERYFRILFQNALVANQKRVIRNISFPAEERYKNFVKSYPKLELVVPQKYIASYLGITPEFLSKMKKRMLKGE
jgi:CRP-like cAMP-binding protein